MGQKSGNTRGSNWSIYGISKQSVEERPFLVRHAGGASSGHSVDGTRQIGSLSGASARLNLPPEGVPLEFGRRQHAQLQAGAQAFVDAPGAHAGSLGGAAGQEGPLQQVGERVSEARAHGAVEDEVDTAVDKGQKVD